MKFFFLFFSFLIKLSRSKCVNLKYENIIHRFVEVFSGLSFSVQFSVSDEIASCVLFLFQRSKIVSDEIS